MGHATFAQTAACEINISTLGFPCDASGTNPEALIDSHLPFFFEYLQTESTSNAEGLGVDSPSDYGAGWVFARWMTDQYATAGAEGAFIKSVINEPQLTGLANVSSHTSQSIPTLVTYFNLATAIFQTPGYTAADVRITVPSFQHRGHFQQGQSSFTCGGTPCGFLDRISVHRRFPSRRSRSHRRRGSTSWPSRFPERRQHIFCSAHRSLARKHYSCSRRAEARWPHRADSVSPLFAFNSGRVHAHIRRHPRPPLSETFH